MNGNRINFEFPYLSYSISKIMLFDDFTTYQLYHDTVIIEYVEHL